MPSSNASEIVWVLAVGLLLALYRYGSGILDVGDAGWLLAAGDPAIHQLGWVVFRDEAWTWPPGVMRGYAAPIGTSLGYTDSLPLLALPAKLLSDWLPRPFQYFGAWAFANQLLQALFGYLLMTRTRAGPGSRILGACFFALCPPFIARAGHIALSSHWLLLASLYTYTTGPARGPRVYLGQWLLWIAVSGLVHPYLATMVAGIALASLVREVRITARLPTSPACAFAAGLLSLLVAEWWATGLFHFEGMSYAGQGFGYYSMNLLAFVDGMGTARFGPELPLLTEGQREGYAYLGLGGLALVLAAASSGLRRSELRETLRGHLPLLLVCAAFTALAISTRISLGDRQLSAWWIDHPLADFLLGAFRASGRFVWPAYYMLVFACLRLLLAGRWAPYATALLASVLLIQLADLQVPRATFGDRRYATRLLDPRWDRALAKRARVVTVPSYQRSLDHGDDYRYFVELAARHDAAITAGPAARQPEAALKREKRRLREQLQRGELDADALYVFSAALFERHRRALEARATCESWDGYAVCLAAVKDD